jgi:sulfur carrier protein ThiS adenylyltransferase
VIGTMMAVEALKFLSGLDVETGTLNLYDAMSTEWRKLGIRKRKNCPVCSKR